MTTGEIIRAIFEGVIAIAAVYGAYQGKMVHLTINSRMSELLAASKNAAHLEGAAEQRATTADALLTAAENSTKP